MAAISAGSNARTDLLERYPELLLLLTYTSFPPLEISPAETDPFPLKLNLEGIDILYVYGLGMGHPFAALKGWLQEKKERRLLFLEDDLAAIDACLQGPHAEPLFLHPQVTIHYLSDPRRFGPQLEELAASHPTDRIEVACSAGYQKSKKRRFQQIRLKLLRQSAIVQAVLTESLYSHKLLRNLLPNIKRWHGSFLASGLRGKFHGIPALICGAGPSLESSIPHLKSLEDRALIIAGGSTIAALSNRGIHPHIRDRSRPEPRRVRQVKGRLFLRNSLSSMLPACSPTSSML